MHARFSTLLPVAALVAVAVAAPGALEIRDSCSNGQMHCCDSTQTSSSETIASLSDLFGIVPFPEDDGLIGFNCSPITGVGAGTGAACNQQTVCCSNVQFNGLINVGCTSIS